MTYSTRWAAGLALTLLAGSALAQGNLLPLPEDKPIVGASTPGLSPDGKTIAFGYQGDLWSAPTAGGSATRLTIHMAHDGYPRYSPDGRWIAFASNRYSTSSINYDIFLIPAGGGEAKQLTTNTTNDYPFDWSPDGTKVLFYSRRSADNFRVYSIDIATKVVKTLAAEAAQLRFPVYSPDGKNVAYNRSGGIGTWWRPRYHGSANLDIYSKQLATGKITRVTDYDGGDMWPLYSADGSRVYYVSDRLTSGTPNLVASPATGGKPALITRHEGGSVTWPAISRDGTTIAYIYDGALHRISTSGGSSVRIAVRAATDDKQNRMSRLALTSSASEIEVSPDGKTLALVVRGEVWTVPAAGGGDAKRLTDNPANDYDIVWSRDSNRLAIVSDRKGNFDIYTVDAKTGETKVVSDDLNDENMPHYAPDGKSLAFLRSGPQGGIYTISTESPSAPVRVAESEGNNLFGVGVESYGWSPDSKWIAFSRRDKTNTNDVWVTPATGGNPTNVTYFPGDNDRPRFSGDGKFLLFMSNRDRGTGAPGSDLYAIPLVKAKEDGTEPTAGKAGEVRIEMDDIENRAKRLTTSGVLSYEPSPDGKTVIFMSAQGGPPDYWAIPAAGGTAQRMTFTGEGTSTPRFASDPSRFFAMGPGGTVKTLVRTGPVWQSSNVPFSLVMTVDRVEERKQAFNEFWRRTKVGFYDGKMHGVDWTDVRRRYEPLLEGVGTQEEFSMFLLSQMVGELNASHSEVSPPGGSGGPVTAELGLSFDESYSGPGLRVTGFMPKGPNDDLGPRIKPGEYVLQISETDVTWNEDLSKVLLDKAGKSLDLLVNSKNTKDGARTVKLKAITYDQWRDLEYERKVDERRAAVEKLSAGKLAYLHIRGMNQPALKRMERELWGRAATREGLVLDIRGNTGGNTHDEILAQISRTSYGYTQPRDGVRSSQPFKHWDKPIVLVMDQDSVSDGEIFPSGFRTLKLGKIVGTPTPGYVIGTYSGTLPDGTGYRIPMWGWYYADGRSMENNGVKPDVLVELSEEDIAASRDRQLETAVDILLKDLPKKAGDTR